MNEWVRLFFGTPRRTLWSIAGIVAILGVLYPPAIGFVFRRLLEAFAPLIQIAVHLAVTILLIGIVLSGFRIMFRGLFGGGRK